MILFIEICKYLSNTLSILKEINTERTRNSQMYRMRQSGQMILRKYLKGYYITGNIIECS